MLTSGVLLGAPWHEDVDNASPFHPFEQMFKLCLSGCFKPTMGKGAPRPLLLDEILQRLLLKSSVSAGRAHCRLCAFARVLLVQSQYFSMTADGQRALEEDVRVALGLCLHVRVRC